MTGSIGSTLSGGVGLGHLLPFGLGGHPPEWDRHRGP